MRLYKCFKTKEERKAWEREQKNKENFRVCMRMTVDQLKKDLYMSKDALTEYKFATVYTFDKN